MYRWKKSYKIILYEIGFFTALFFSHTHAFAQQSDINGVVSIFNSQTHTGKRQYVVNAQVDDDFGKAQAVITDYKGQFKLTYIGVNEKTSVTFHVKKQGLEVVNKDALTVVVGQYSAVNISMADPDSINEYRRVIYQIGKTEAEKYLENLLSKKNRELADQKKNSVKNNNKINQLEQEIAQIEDKRKKIEAQAEDLAKRYAPVNLDDATPLFRKAFLLFQKGDIDSAQLVLTHADLAGKVDSIQLEEKKIDLAKKEFNEREALKNDRKKSCAEAIQLDADLHKTRYEFDEASKSYELLIKLDSLNAENLFNYAAFLAWLNQYDKAIYYYSKALNIYKTSSQNYESGVANTQNNLGILYANKNDFTKAEAAYQEALEIFKRLASSNPQTYEPDVAMTQNNLGILYADKNDFTKAEAAYQEALEIYKRLESNNLQTYEPKVALMQNNLGSVYADKNDFTKAEAAFQEALKIFKRLESNNPQTDEPAIANTQNNLGILYYDKNDFTKAEAALKEALEIYKRLVSSNPKTYEPAVANTQSNLGNVYELKNDFTKAEAAYQEALEIRKRLASSNPQTYEPDVALTQNNLGTLYGQQNDFTKAEAALKEALEIYKRLESSNPQTYEPDVAQTENNLGNLYADKNDFTKAEAAYQEALEISKRLASNNPQTYEPDVAQTQYNLGTLYGQQNDFTKAEAALKEALEIYKRLESKNTQTYEPDVALTQNNLGVLYLGLKKYLEAEGHLIEALKTGESLQNKYPDVYTNATSGTAYSLLLVYNGILETFKYDAFKTPNDDHFKTAENLLIVQSKRDTAIANRLANYYGNRSWYLLFASKFKEAQEAAEKGLAIIPSLTWIKTNLAHSLLFQGKYDDALMIYTKLKGLRDENGKSFADIGLQDLDELEKNGITCKDINKMRGFLKI
jgi:tetratricopeptide (TPR) repeat protein